MTPEIKKRKRLELWDQSEIFRQTRNMKIYFVMLMGHQIIEFWMLCAFSLYRTKTFGINSFVLFVMCGLWAVTWIFCLKHCLGGSIKSFSVWLLFTTWLNIYHQDVTAIILKLSYSRWYYWENKKATLNLVRFTFHMSQLCWKFRKCCRWQMLLVNDLH